MKYRLKINTSSLKAEAEAAIGRLLSAASDRVGALVVQQVKARFDNQGDEDGPWPPLWASDQEKVAAVTRKVRKGREFRAQEHARETKRINRYEQRIAKDRSSGKITDSQARDRQVRAQARRSRIDDILNKNHTDLFREGGERMRDTGAMQSSFFYASSVDGLKAVITVGSPLEIVLYHQSGFTTNGPNYIPLTKRAHRGWSEELIPGYDYVVLASVTVPPTPMLRLTSQNIEDILSTIAPSGRR